MVCGDTNTKVAEQPNAQEPSTSRDDEQVLPAKKAKILSAAHTVLYVYAKLPDSCISILFSGRARKIKIFSATEIEESTGVQKIYREFWNAKAEELCRSTIRKTEYLKDEMKKVNLEINDKCPVDVL